LTRRQAASPDYAGWYAIANAVIRVLLTIKEAVLMLDQPVTFSIKPWRHHVIEHGVNN
jgi:hypothetical protein